MKKICTLCKKPFPLSKFWKQLQGKYGVRSRCKKCTKLSNLKWENSNPDKKRSCWRKMAARKRSRLDYRISSNIGRVIRRSLNNKNFQPTFSILDYSIGDLKHHLEQQFTNGMNWKNYGKWHIDHIKPKSLFSFSTKDDQQFKECWSLDNLQPLWAEDNQKKSDLY